MRNFLSKHLSVYQRNRLLLLVGTVVSVLLFRWAGDVFGIPTYWEASASLMMQKSAVLAVAVAAILWIIATVIGTIIAASVRADAGFVVATFGLISLSARGGPMRYVLFNGSGSAPFVKLIVETVILFAVGFVCWVLSRRIATVVAPRSVAAEMGDDDSLDQNLLALASHVLAMIAAMSLLARTDQKMQVVFSVALSSFLASLTADTAIPVRSSFYTWAGPFLTAIVAYAFGLFSHQNAELGQTSGFFAALGRPLPLDYAGAGPSAALLGLWVSRAWRHAREEGEDLEEPAPQP